MALSFSQSKSSERERNRWKVAEKKEEQRKKIGSQQPTQKREREHIFSLFSCFFFVFISSFSSEGEHKTHNNSISRRNSHSSRRIFTTTKFAFHSSVCELVLMPRNAFVIVMLFTYSTRKEFHFSSLCMGQQKRNIRRKNDVVQIHRQSIFPEISTFDKHFFFRFLVRAHFCSPQKERKLTRQTTYTRTTRRLRFSSLSYALL